jgi:hypothetical protein
MPLQRATTQMNIGTALWRLGERETGTARLEEAVADSREALQEWIRVRVPLQRAKTQMNLGDAPSAAILEAQLPKARALAQKLAKR